MKNLKQASKVVPKSWFREILFPVTLFVVVLVSAGSSALYFNHISNMQSIELLRQSVRRAVVQCYSIEGKYPEEIDYLEENYGLDYNHDKYFVDYEVFGANVMPNIEVYERK